jgi:transposase
LWLFSFADRCPVLAKGFAEGAAQGPLVHKAVPKARLQLKTELGKRSEPATGFVVFSQRGIGERTLAWLTRGRRLAQEVEKRTRTATAFVQLASLRLM